MQRAALVAAVLAFTVPPIALAQNQQLVGTWVVATPARPARFTYVNVPFRGHGRLLV